MAAVLASLLLIAAGVRRRHKVVVVIIKNAATARTVVTARIGTIAALNERFATLHALQRRSSARLQNSKPAPIYNWNFGCS